METKKPRREPGPVRTIRRRNYILLGVVLPPLLGLVAALLPPQPTATTENARMAARTSNFFIKNSKRGLIGAPQSGTSRIGHGDMTPFPGVIPGFPRFLFPAAVFFGWGRPVRARSPSLRLAGRGVALKIKHFRLAHPRPEFGFFDRGVRAWPPAEEKDAARSVARSVGCARRSATANSPDATEATVRSGPAARASVCAPASSHVSSHPRFIGRRVE